MSAQSVWYFAYGSNVDPRTFQGRRRMRPLRTEVARLDGYALCFDLPVGPGERGVGNVRREPEDLIWGVAYEIEGAEAQRLDATEGVAHGAYARLPVRIETRDAGWLDAYTYQSSRGVSGRLPSRRYMGLLLAGARHYDLPASWIDRLRAWPLAVDERDHQLELPMGVALRQLTRGALAPPPRRPVTLRCRAMARGHDGSLWIFGYGSLVWRPAFAFAERRAGFIEGFARRFWQGSTDHRGLPGAPGRVATVVQAPGAVCWGTAYRVAAAEREDVLATLDHRERGGFVREEVLVELAAPAAAAPRVRALLYVATPDNPNYLGPAPLEQIAAQVRRSRGPSGPNVEYVVELARALREMGADDEHVYALDALLRD